MHTTIVPRREVVRRRRGLRPTVLALEGRKLLSSTPVTFATVSGVPGTSGYYRSPVTVTLTPYEAGVDTNTLRTYYRINDGPLMSGRTVPLVNDGYYEVTFVSADSTGRCGAATGQFVAIDKTTPTIVAYATPNSLWPPNHRFVAVTVTGHVSDNLSGVVPGVFYDVVDSEGTDQPSGLVPVDRNGNFSFVVYLQASRLGQDKNGRLYTIDVFGVDAARNFGVGATYVLVPHDQGNG
jgi:hypothetical protein